ncbi:MAG: aminotransferase class V-fold PLP-dependent enzyme [Bacteroidia bacterium]
MPSDTLPYSPQSLEPHDWSHMRALGHQMIEDMMDFLEGIRDQPSWKPVPEEVKSHFRQDLPQQPTDAAAVYQEFKDFILPYPKGNIHPRFFSWIQGTGTPLGALSDMLASAMNPNVTIGEHAAMYVDQQVVDWCKQMLNYPAEASGILLSGGSMANITGLTVARNAQTGINIRKLGLKNADVSLVLYCSSETHSCITKAAEIIGIGTDAVRHIPVNDHFEMDMERLVRAIEDDLSAGLTPFCVVGTAGTVNTGAIDPLEEIYAICKKYKLWFHVDGAYGALAKIDPNCAERLKFIEQADSVAFDLHKWLHVPYELGCLLVRDARAHRNSFAITPNYLLQSDRGLAGGPDSINNYGFELSRSFKALKVWMVVKEHGIQRYAELIAKDNAQATYLAGKISQHPNLQLLAPVNLSIACFQYTDSALNPAQINKLNKELIIQLQEQGIASPSSTILNGKYCIRVCIVNHKTTYSDLDLMLQAIIDIGRKLTLSTLEKEK